MNSRALEQVEQPVLTSTSPLQRLTLSLLHCAQVSAMGDKQVSQRLCFCGTSPLQRLALSLLQCAQVSAMETNRSIKDFVFIDHKIKK